MPLWRLFPTSAVPGVGVAIPTMISGDPDVLAARPRPTFLDNKMRWTYANDNVCHDRADCHRTHKYQSSEALKHTRILSL